MTKQKKGCTLSKPDRKMQEIEEECKAHNIAVQDRIEFLSTTLDEILPKNYWDKEDFSRYETTCFLMKLFIKTEDWARTDAIQKTRDDGLSFQKRNLKERKLVEMEVMDENGKNHSITLEEGDGFCFNMSPIKNIKITKVIVQDLEER